MLISHFDYFNNELRKLLVKAKFYFNLFTIILNLKVI